MYNNLLCYYNHKEGRERALDFGFKLKPDQVFGIWYDEEEGKVVPVVFSYLYRYKYGMTNECRIAGYLLHGLEWIRYYWNWQDNLPETLWNKVSCRRHYGDKPQVFYLQ